MTTPKVTTVTIRQVEQAATIISNTLADHYTIDQIAKKVKLPSKTLKAVFKQVYGIGVYGYLRIKRMEKAQAMLLNEESLDYIIVSVGFANKSNFCKAFRRFFNESPERWAKKQQDLIYERKTPRGTFKTELIG